MKENNQEYKQEKIEKKDNTTEDAISKLKEIGLKEVSNKTFINLENLTALLEKDFAKLNRTKALGFIQILQREFDVNLHELKTEYLLYDNGQKKSKKIQTIQDMTEADQQPKKILRYILLALIVFGGWYYFSDNEDARINPMDLNVVHNEIVTQEAKESLLVADEVIDENSAESDVSKEDEEEEVDLNKVVQEMFKSTDLNDSNDSTESSDENSSENLEESTDTNQTDSLKSDESNVSEEKSILEVATQKDVQEQKPAEKSIQESAEKLTIPKKVKKIKEVKNENRGGLYIQPIRKAWVGVIFLDSMKKKDYLIRRPLVLDASKDQIIMVGHKNFKIFNKQLELGVKSRKKGRFLYKDGELREISKREYDRYRGRVRW